MVSWGHRAASYPIDPLWRLWLPELPRTFIWGVWDSLGLHYDGMSPALSSRRTVVMPLAMEHDYGEALLQRGSLLEQDQLDVSGVLRGGEPSNAADYVILHEGASVIGASPVYPFLDFMRAARFNIATHPLNPDDTVALEFWKGDKAVKLVPLPLTGTTAVELENSADTWDVVTSRGSFQPTFSSRLKLALIKASDVILFFGLFCCSALAFVRARSEGPCPLLRAFGAGIDRAVFCAAAHWLL